MLSSILIGLAAGGAATPHCLGMCGGFPVHLARSSHSGKSILRIVLFLTGKAFTYVFLGLLAASMGAIIFRNTSLAPVAPVIRVAAGVVTALFGALMLGVRLPRLASRTGSGDSGILQSMLSKLVVDPTPVGALMLGMGTGFLPCPLPMGMLAAAAASHSITEGAGLMLGVGLGTVPGLLALGVFGIGLDRRVAKSGMKVAGAVVLAIGLLTVGRASGLIPHAAGVDHVVPSCCQGEGR